MFGKVKGRSFERKLYKVLRDSGIFIKIQLTLGSGSSDEPSDITADDYVIEAKNGSAHYISEPNINKWWNGVEDSCEEHQTPILIYKQNHKPVMVMFEHYFVKTNYPQTMSMRVRVEFDDWIKYMKWEHLNKLSRTIT